MTWQSDISIRRESTGIAGFTLVELLVVIAILGIMLGMLGVASRPVSPAIHARSAAQEISAALRAARSAAEMGNHSVAFTIDVSLPQYQWDRQTSHALPQDVRLALMTGQNQVLSGSKGSIRFYPDGSSSGGRVSVNGGGQQWMVGVDWLSGRVSVVHAAR